MSTAGGPKLINTGLVLGFDAADRNSYAGSGTTLTDISGFGNNGTLGSYNTLQETTVGNVSVPHLRSSKSFAATSYALVPSSPIITVRNNISWCFVAYKTSDLERQTVFGKTSSSPWDGTIVNLSLDGNGQLSWWSGSSYGAWWSTGLTVPTNKWVFAAGNWTGSTRKAWLAYDGLSLTSASNNSNTFNSPTDSTSFGLFTESWNPAPSGYILDGGIALMLLYNVYLTDDQIRQNYNVLRGRFRL